MQKMDKPRSGPARARLVSDVSRVASGVGLGDGVFDDEVVAPDHAGAPNSPALQTAISKGKPEDLVLFAFDLLFDGREDLRRRLLSQRNPHQGAQLVCRPDAAVTPVQVSVASSVLQRLDLCSSIQAPGSYPPEGLRRDRIGSLRLRLVGARVARRTSRTSRS